MATRWARVAICILAAFMLALFMVLWPRRPQERIVNRRAPSPILFVHGIGGSAQTWNEAGLTSYLRSRELEYGGVVRIYNGGAAAMNTAPDADFFLVEISPSFQSLERWEESLATAITAVRKETGASQVVLVGHSAGGLAARKYLVDHPDDHGVAKLVTIASPHRGSELALLSLVKKTLREGTAQEGMGGLVYRTLDERLSAYERGLGIPLDAPIFEDLLPEHRNPGLWVVNRKPHPTIDYACILAVGSPDSLHWEEIASLDKGSFWENLRTRFISVFAFLEGVSSSRGDGAVLAVSQDLRAVDFFKQHKELIEKCIEVDVGHQGVNEQHRVIANGVESPVRFLRATRLGEPEDDPTEVDVDFHDYFAGLSKITARLPGTLEALPISRRVVMDNGVDSFGRATIGPFDSSVHPRIEVIIQTLNRRKYGRSLLLRDTPGSVLPKRDPPRPLTVTMVKLEGIPGERPSGLPWDPDLSPPDVQVTLSVDRHEVFRSRTYEDAGRAILLREPIAFEEEPWEHEVSVKVWHDGFVRELIGQSIFRVGEFPRSSAVVPIGPDLTLQLSISGGGDERVSWSDEPLLVNSSN